MNRRCRTAVAAAFAAGMFVTARSIADTAPAYVVPSAVLDLDSAEAQRLLNAEWRYCDARIIEAAAPGASGATGAAAKTHDITPRAGAAEFDDRDWDRLPPETLQSRRTPGLMAGGWYRLRLTVPPRIGSHDTAGGTLVFEIAVDDYAEVWVDGALPQVLGQAGGPLAAGWNAPNRLVLTRHAKPGAQIQLAVFAMNGPLSAPPRNQVWVRSASLELYPPGAYTTAAPVKLEVERRDPALSAIVPAGAVLERVATGFTFAEGPVWIPAAVGGAGSMPIAEGYLLFSDPNRNTIYRCTADGQVSIYRVKSGYSGTDIGEYRQPGSNGLTLDAHGLVTLCEHGRRRVSRLEKTGAVTVLADRWNNKRLNSPNDLVYRSDGALFFTDPFFGLPRFRDDPRREQDAPGVYCVRDGKVQRLQTDLGGPNGIAFSPDEKRLYVANWDDHRKVLMRYDCAADGSLSNPAVHFDMTHASGDDALDGVKVDQQGHLYVSGPGGLWIISADGKHLGTLRGPEHPHNLAWGDEDGRTLYWAAQTSIYRVRLNVPGIRPRCGA